MRYHLFCILSLLLLLTPAQAQQDRIEVLTLHHRSAEDLIPLLRPLVGSEGGISGQSDRLLVRTTPERLRQIRELLAQLDIPPHQLLITVRQVGQDTDTYTAAGASGNVILGPNTARGKLSAGIGSGSTRGSDQILQQIQVLEGGEAYIQVGQEIPRQERFITRQGPFIEQGTVTYYQPVTTGFYARPRLHGDQVTLEIAPHRERENPAGSGRIETQGLHTTVSGRLGEWLTIGGVEENNQQHSSGLLHYGSAQSQQQRRILLKVDKLP